MIDSVRVFDIWRLVALALLPLAVLRPPVIASAQDAAPSDWQRLPLREPVVRLFTPRSGSFLAQARSALYRSDDAGATWASVPLPPLQAHPSLGLAADQRGTGQIAVDPGDDQAIYAAGTDGLLKTSDGGRKWQLVRPSATRVVAVAASTVTPRLVYMVQSDGQLARSPDAGQTWQNLPGQTFGGLYGGADRGGSYGCEVRALLFPHPQVANRLVVSIHCHSGSDQMQASAGNIDQSFDVGDTRVPFLRPDWAPSYTGFVVGGQGAEPTRFYLTTDTSSRSLSTGFLSSRLFKSDDDGANWTELTGIWDDPGDGSFVQVGGLVEDPTRADVLYLGLNQLSPNPPRLGYVLTRSWVRVSPDGGQSWSDSSCADLGGISDLALGIDRQNLYAATQGGVWRLPLIADSLPSATCPQSTGSMLASRSSPR